MKITATLLTLLLLFLSTAPTQDDTQLNLPEGTIVHFAKGFVKEVLYSPDGTRLAVLTSIGISLCETTTYREIDLLGEHTDQINQIAFSPDSATLAGEGRGGLVRLWDTETGTLKQTLTGRKGWITKVAFSPDSATLASEGEDNTVRLWDTETGTLKQTLTGHTAGINDLTFSPDGKVLACATRSDDGTVWLWDTETGTLKRTLTGHTAMVNSVAFSPDGTTFVSGGEIPDATVRLWDAKTGEPKQILTTHVVVAEIVFSPDGSTLAVRSEYQVWRFWDTETWELKWTLTPQDEVWYVSVSFSPDGVTLASGGQHVNNAVRLWDVKTGEPKRILTGHTDRVQGVAFSPEGKTLASGSDDGTVLVWKVD